MIKQKFDIFGMTCSACVSHVEKAVKKLNGVKNVNVNLLSNNMILEYDDNILKVNDILKAVEEAGYEINLNTNEKKVKTEKESQDETKSMKNRVITSICFLIPLMYIAMHGMLNKAFGIPIPMLIKNFFSGTENALNFAFIQLLLLLPILYVNKNYFIVGIKRLLKKSPNMDTLIAMGSGAATIYGIFAIFNIGYGFRS